jgi:hypothetical protein
MSCLPLTPNYRPIGDGIYALEGGGVAPSVSRLARWALRGGRGDAPRLTRCRLTAMRHGAALHEWLPAIAARRALGGDAPPWAARAVRFLRRWPGARWHAEAVLVSTSPPLVGRVDLLGVSWEGVLVVDVKTGALRIRDLLQAALYAWLASSVLRRPCLGSYVLALRDDTCSPVRVGRLWLSAARGLATFWALTHDAEGRQLPPWQVVGRPASA